VIQLLLLIYTKLRVFSAGNCSQWQSKKKKKTKKQNTPVKHDSAHLLILALKEAVAGTVMIHT
jgi:hypothetical protein